MIQTHPKMLYRGPVFTDSVVLMRSIGSVIQYTIAKDEAEEAEMRADGWVDLQDLLAPEPKRQTLKLSKGS